MTSSGSIGRLNYMLVADTSGFTKGIVAARNELSLAKKVFEQTRTPVEAYGRALQKLDDLHDKKKLETDLYHRAVTKLQSDFRLAAQAANEAKKAEEAMAAATAKATAETARANAEAAKRQAALERQAAAQARLNREIEHYRRTQESANRIQQKRLDHFVKNNEGISAGEIPGAIGGQIGAIAAGIGAMSWAGFIKNSVDEFAAFEQAASDFRVLTGSIAEGNRLIEEFRDLAAETPLALAGVTKAAQTMLSFGVQSSGLTEKLQRLGDISGGNAERFQSLALVYGQVTAAQRLQGQDLLQFVNAGWNPLLNVTKRTGESMMEVRKRMEEGKVAFSEVEQALIDATSAGGLFFGRMDAMAETSKGRMDLYNDSVSRLKMSIGDLVEPITRVTLAIGEWGADFLTNRIEDVNEGAAVIGSHLRGEGDYRLKPKMIEPPKPAAAPPVKVMSKEDIRAIIAADEAKWQAKQRERFEAIQASRNERGKDINREYIEWVKKQWEAQERQAKLQEEANRQLEKIAEARQEAI